MGYLKEKVYDVAPSSNSVYEFVNNGYKFTLGKGKVRMPNLQKALRTP